MLRCGDAGWSAVRSNTMTQEDASGSLVCSEGLVRAPTDKAGCRGVSALFSQGRGRQWLVATTSVDLLPCASLLSWA
jgi:hypothetical protein